MFDKKLFGERVQYYRNKRGLTLNALSEKIGIGLNYLSDIEHGKHTPTVKTIVGIINSLDVTYTSLTSIQECDETLGQVIENKSNLLDEKGIDLLLCIVKNYI